MMTADTQTERRFAPILLGVALSLVIDVAAAEVASDNELYAAYCIGVLQQTQQENRKLEAEYEQHLLADPNDKQSQDDARRFRQEADKGLKDLDQKLSRFRTYLAVRGFWTGNRDQPAHTGIQVALRRGRSDVQNCYQFSEKTCTPRCTSERLGLRLLDAELPRRIIECADQCRAENAACQSSKRCQQADNLPF
jgi:hypothetical protein